MGNFPTLKEKFGVKIDFCADPMCHSATKAIVQRIASLSRVHTKLLIKEHDLGDPEWTFVYE